MVAEQIRLARQTAAIGSKRFAHGAVVTVLSIALLVPASATPARAIPLVPCLDAPRLCTAVYRPGHYGRGWYMVIAGPAARYFHKYRLCVHAPDGTHQCRAFRIAPPRFGHFESRIAWRTHFDGRGPGRYFVRWFRLPARHLLGKPASFRVGPRSRPARWLPPSGSPAGAGTGPRRS